jgi:hypothetical protein
MPTQPTVDRRPADQLDAEQEAISFRAATLEEAVAVSTAWG